MEIPTLETPRLRLRPFEDGDVPAIALLANAREVAAGTLRIPHPYGEQDARTFIAHCREFAEKGLSANFAITRLEDSALIGAVGLEIEQAHRRAELGYWIGVPYWGRGYATEAARAVLHFGFGELALYRILAHHLDFNSASGKVLQNLGMRHEGRLRGHVAKWEHHHDVEAYGILREQFFASRD
ncbi:MAG TPA: GNAT family N-acetyltransferase [Terriglobales bacterium]|jgi:RimJ/RimL family protein N-acetyltransferase